MTGQPDERSVAGDHATLSWSELRRRAETMVGSAEAQELQPLSPETARQLLHELRVHQIELEMQNEELRRAQEALEASRSRYFDLYDLAPVGYLTLSAQGLILEANLTAATLLAAPRAALAMQRLSRFILPEDEDVYYRHCKRLLGAGEPQQFELRLQRQDDAPFWVQVEATVAQNKESGAQVCRVVMIDIRARKQAETELKHERDQIDLLNSYMVDRELRMVELKKETNDLLRSAGKPPNTDGLCLHVVIDDPAGRGFSTA